MIYQADWLLSLDAAPVSNGWMQVEADRIVAMGDATNLPPDVEVQKFPGCVLMPGLINAHCHLELTSIHNQLHPGKSFPVWVSELRSLTASMES